MKRFSELCSLLSQVSSEEYKEILLSDYLDKSPEEDILWALFLFSGRKIKRFFNLAQLWEMLPEMTGLPVWLIEESLQVSRDKAETISLLLLEPVSKNSLLFSEIMNFTDELNYIDSSAGFEKTVNLLNNLTSIEKYYFLKIVSGSFRSIISIKTIVNVISRKYSISEISAHHLLKNTNPVKDDLKTQINHYKKYRDVFKIYPFNPSCEAENKSEQLGDTKCWQAEWKWDGIRTQLIYRSGELLLWTKQNELMTENFPELYSITGNLPNGTVLDGEIIAFSNGKPLPNSVLQSRLKKRTFTKKDITESPVAYILYDILEFNGSDIRNNPLHKRRNILESIIAKSGIREVLYISPVLEFKTLKTLHDLKNNSAENNCKGIILKKKDSVYSDTDNWICLNIEPYYFNGVLLYAQRGLNTGMYSEFTFGAWHNDELITFAKTSGGLSESEITEVTEFIKNNTIEKFGPVRTVKPELVFEIHFEGISESNRHKSGIALRNPKIHRWFKDKKPHEAGHLKNLLELLNAGK